MIFVPRDFNSKEFISARAMSSIDPANGGVLYFTLIAAGHPVGAPTVKVSPKLTAALNLRFVYVPGLGTLTAANNNPIPGESDNALIAWTIAYALAKEREDRSPDPNWLAIYATEKQNILTRLTPRQTQEPDIAEGIFEDLW